MPGFGHESVYEVTPTEVVFLDQDDDHCVAEEDGDNHNQVDVKKCLEEYVASQMNCTLPWLAHSGSFGHLPLCAHPVEYDAYLEVFSEVVHFDAKSISNIAKCTPSCKRTEYSLKPVSSFPTELDYSRIGFYFGKDRFGLKKQYYTYDFQNFLADFGGYLGLLLGYSLLGFYDTLTTIFKHATDKKRTRAKIDKNMHI